MSAKQKDGELHNILEKDDDDDEDENEKIEIQLQSSVIKVNYINLFTYSKLIRDEYQTLEKAKKNLSEKFQTFQNESKVTDDNSILFFSTFKNKNFLINNQTYCDLCKLSNFFQVKRLIKILDEFKDNHNFDPDFIINEILKQIQNNSDDAQLFNDSKFSFDMETNLYGKVNECLKNERFSLLPVSIVYRIISKSTEEISSDLLFDFITKSIEKRCALLSFLNLSTLSDNKFGELIDLYGQNQHFFQYLPPNLMLLKTIKDENKAIKTQLDEMKEKYNKLQENLNDAFKFAEYMIALDRDSNAEFEIAAFLESCSKRGNPLASLCISFLKLDGPSQDYNFASNYMQKSYEEGNMYAPCSIGFFYEKGIGVKTDYSKAIEYYEQSAEKGDSIGFIKLANLYMEGKGVEKNISKAIDYLQQAEALGSSAGAYILAELYNDGKEVEKDFSKAFNYYKKSAELGHNEALEIVGNIYEKGEFVEKNLNIALDYYEKAAKSIFPYGGLQSKINIIKEQISNGEAK